MCFHPCSRLAAVTLTVLLYACDSRPPAQPALDLSASELELFAPDSSGELPITVASAPHGNVWALKRMMPFLTLYDTAGNVVRVFGDSGGGPAELRRPVGIASLGTGIAVWDNAKRVIVEFDSTGRGLGQIRPAVTTSGIWAKLPIVSYGRPGQFLALPHGWALSTYRRSPQQSVDLNFQSVVALDSVGNITATLFDAASDTAIMLERLGRARELVPVPLWTACPDGQVLAYRPASGTLTRTSADGHVLRSDTVDHGGAKLTDDMIRLNLESQIRGLAPAGQPPSSSDMKEMVNSVLQQSKATGRHPDVGPAFVDLLCDAGGRAWLDRFSLADSPIGYARSWLLVDKDGNRRDANLPAGFRLLRIGPDGGLGYVTDSVGIVSLARIAIPQG